MGDTGGGRDEKTGTEAQRHRVELKATVKATGKLFQGDLTKTVEENLTSAMNEVIELMVREVMSRTPSGVFGDKGGLRSSITGEVFRGTPVIRGIVASNSQYAEVIEKGRSAGKAWPPKGTLTPWIYKKFGQPPYKDLKTGERTISLSSLSFMIRRKIGVKGFDGVQMFEKSLIENWPRIQRIFENGGFEIAKDLNA